MTAIDRLADESMDIADTLVADPETPATRARSTRRTITEVASDALPRVVQGPGTRVLLGDERATR